MKNLRVSIPTRDGDFAAEFSDRGLCALSFPRRGGSASSSGAEKLPANVREWVKLTKRALEALLANEAAPVLPPLDLGAGTEFQQAVWKAMRAIPAGQTRTYAQLAAALKRPRAARAVGQACGANPIPVLVPCHRVVAAGGGLGGFSGGLDWKRRLLAREAAAIE